MKPQPSITRRIPIIKDNDQWKLHQLFKDFTEKLDKLPDAGEVRRNPKRSAPQGIVPMVF
ncbi:hypothetical protein J7E50_02930 [Pedobacter sp. ISL-68]|uniref:hypothetical protein n=1 Tax=unclassified Pedobacter TaxID=2628915 RepID=UPI001BEA2F49|nr:MULTISPECIES: hypothetical protein [unclassified Pedobacter]MBT2560175.1 hypothetical protein [Pedobacter sp. ISL-64]MBT2589154.1 hypothetical protein [Pedobacter sp. ISL-68]